MCKTYEEQMRPVLVYDAQELTSEVFKSLFSEDVNKGSTFAEKQAYSWFLAYIEASDGVKNEDFPRGKLNTLLHFCSGLWDIPPYGLARPITITYLDDDDSKELMEATGCTCIVHLPLVHSKQSIFNKKIDISLINGHTGFGCF